MPRKLTIFQKGLAMIAFPILFQMLFTGLLLLRQSYTEDTVRWALHTKDVIAQAETMFRFLVEANSGMRGFVATGEARVNETFERAMSKLPGEVDTLRKLINDNPPQQRRLKVITDQIDQFTAHLLELHRAATEQDRSQVLERLREASRDNPIDAIRVNLDRFLKEEDKLDRARLIELRQAQRHQVWILVGGEITLLIIGAATIWSFSRSVIRRLAVLNENVHRLATGETLAPMLGGGDEISAVDRSFHDMAQSLSAASSKEKEYQESLEKRTAELTASNRELSQKSDENEMFVYSVSHDLRSPLVNLQGFSKELSLAMQDLKEVISELEVPPGARRKGEEILEHGMAEPVHFIQTAVTRLSTIIDALLRLSRVGRIEYQRREVDADVVIARVVGAMQSTIAQKKAKVRVQPNLPLVWGDPTAVEQIFANLIGNALNYLDKARPGTVEIGSDDEHAETTPGMTVYYVRDNGLGIPEAYLSKVFAIFQRVHGNVAQGEGIGLALVRRMVERHGGRIWVESQENVGSTFFVSLPKPPAPEPADPPAGDSPTAENAG